MPVLRAFSIYFTSYGIQAPIPSTDPGDGRRLIGALALAATAVSENIFFTGVAYNLFQVEQGYRMHSTGDYVSHGNDFSSSKWLTTTAFYLDKIQNNLTTDNWTAIFQALHHLEASDVQEHQIQTGAPLGPTNREALLPADPPSPPALD